MAAIRSIQAALAYVREHGVVLESARGGARSLAEAIAGEPIRGSWWSHPRGKTIFSVTRGLRDSAEVLTCRLLDGKVTFVHRNRWPALVRLAESIPRERLAAIREVHSAEGRHQLLETPFPDWVTAEVLAAARKLSESEARVLIGQS